MGCSLPTRADRAASRTADDLIVAAGGDGTVGAVANFLAYTGAIMGIIPLGTSNDVARSLRLPIRVEDAVHALATGKVATVDLGTFFAENEPPRYFAHAAAMGIDVKFAKLATQVTLRRRLGRFTYAVAAVLALRDREQDVALGEDARPVGVRVHDERGAHLAGGHLLGCVAQRVRRPDREHGGRHGVADEHGHLRGREPKVGPSGAGVQTLEGRTSPVPTAPGAASRAGPGCGRTAGRAAPPAAGW